MPLTMEVPTEWPGPLREEVPCAARSPRSRRCGPFGKSGRCRRRKQRAHIGAVRGQIGAGRGGVISDRPVGPPGRPRLPGRRGCRSSSGPACTRRDAARRRRGIRETPARLAQLPVTLRRVVEDDVRVILRLGGRRGANSEHARDKQAHNYRTDPTSAHETVPRAHSSPPRHRISRPAPEQPDGGRRFLPPSTTKAKLEFARVDATARPRAGPMPAPPPAASAGGGSPGRGRRGRPP